MRNRDADMEGEGHVMMEAETGVVRPPAKGRQGTPRIAGNTGSRGRQGKSLPSSLRRECVPAGTCFQTSGFQSHKRIRFFGFKPPVCILCYGTPRKLNVDVPLGIETNERATRFTFTGGLPENVESRSFAPACGTGTCRGGAGPPGW